MERKRLILILAAAGAVLIAFLAMAYFGARLLISRLPTPTPPPRTITLCDRDASGLCVISFGTNADDEMVINLQLADEEFPTFYAQVESRGVTARFRCQAVEEDPTTGFCSGARTPLGEPLALRLYAAKDDALLATGDFVLMALALPTFSSATATEGPAPTEPTAIAPSPTFPGEGGPPIPTFPARTPVRTPTRNSHANATRTSVPGYP